ncbi:MAG: FliI/YscN family ATPase [Dehalococcoidia bacterium]
MPLSLHPSAQQVSAIELARYRERLAGVNPVLSHGSVRQVVGLLVEVDGLAGQLGELCRISRVGAEPVLAEIVGLREQRTLVMPFGDLRGVQSGARVTADGGLFTVPVGDQLLGRVIDGLARPIDNRGPLVGPSRQALAAQSPPALQRRTISEPLATGVRAIDGALTVGKGQRIGVFAGSGVGKSTVMAMIARHASSDVNVIALVGERGREVREFVERALGEDGLARSVVVVATSDEPALLKMQAAMVATTIAEAFRAQGRDVTLLMDSVTRYAMANREIGLAIGEPPTMKGYPPSVFSALSRLLERAGTSEEGTITAFYAVLVESDDLSEPITDAVRGTLDGHIVLTRELAAQNHFPAIDLLQSTSRVMPSIVTSEHLDAAGRLRELLAIYERSRDLVTIGAYQAGTDPRLDEALARLPAIEAFLRQRPNDAQPLDETVAALLAVTGGQATPTRSLHLVPNIEDDERAADAVIDLPPEIE